ncbi:carboxylate--amine ligase [Actinomycetospora straminea]|uniref:ATP-grasp domain-containing protein n=1 Tax=Actinomycetospora straminea TaxID=663607 RepID=A0ABP9E159_9PSEU|nr:carboxylate--amine ligase [Actinomycetospora straminea]MDD7931027.1 carboxylate--amine ligase [Actinomycetospora straminea]
MVLKLDHNVMHHGGLGVIRTLGRHGVPVYSVHEHRWAPAARSRFINGRILWNPSADHVGELLAGLERLSDIIGREAVLLPTDDAGAVFLAEHGDALRQRFRFPAPPRSLPRSLADKHSLLGLCAAHNVPAPRSVTAMTTREVADFVDLVGFPLLVKKVKPWVVNGSGPALSASVARSRPELDDLLADVVGEGEILLQEYIPHAPEHDWGVAAYFDESSRGVPVFTGIKERSYPSDAGQTTLGRARSNPDLVDLVRRFLSAVGYRGIVDMDFREDPRDGQYKLLDVNPRIGAQFRLGRDAAGLDVALALHLDLTGRKVVERPQDVDRRLLVESYDLVPAVKGFRARSLSYGDWWHSVRQRGELAWFAADDLAPFGLMCLRMVRRVARSRHPRRPVSAQASQLVFESGRRSDRHAGVG